MNPIPFANESIALSDNGSGGAVIVVGFDGSKTSRDAFHWACGEAGRLGGCVIAVFVSTLVRSEVTAAATAAGAGSFAIIEPIGFSSGGVDDDIATSLHEEIVRGTKEDEPNVMFVHAFGGVASELLKVATVHRADQIVVGRSAKARHRVAGSLGRRLVRKQGTPVVVVVP